MTADLQLIESLEASPVEIERRLALAFRGIGRKITERAEILLSLTAADQLNEGYVITSEEQAVAVADLVAQVIDGEKALAHHAGIVLRIPKEMEKALRESVGNTKDRLARAKATGNGARVAWQNTLRRRAAEAEEKARLAAQEAARRAAEEAAETGEDAPPAVEVAPIEISRTVSGGTGKMGLQTRIRPTEIVDDSACPAQWKQIIGPVALASFNAAVLMKQIERPEPGESVIFKGVRFEAVESVVNRR